jgi:succinate dehydrogenase / fumarate reductase, cytochrome b subunit
MDRVERPVSPHLQIYAWSITNTLSILHRLTGLLLSFGALAFVGWLLAVAGGIETYTNAQTLFASVWFKPLLMAWAFCFFFHFANGIRHLFWDVGLGFERRSIQMSGWAVVAVAVIATAAYTLFAII